MRPPVLRLHHNDLIIDSFAGGGGASLGIEWALGRSPDIAINHDAEAIAMHAENHPSTRHLHGNVWDYDPKGVCRGRPVALLWVSPDCTHFSKAKGGKPVKKEIRGLADVVIRWAEGVKPKVIILENVEEFQKWGPLLKNGKPDPRRIGEDFRRWWAELKACGYQIEMRELRACDFGAPTTRKRLFIIARSDGLPIVWPDPTHGPNREPYRTAGECIDWSIPVPSIFEPGRDLVDNTLRRIARGVFKFVLHSAKPFIIPTTHPRDQRVYSIDEPLRTITSAHRGELALIAPSMIQTSWGERKGQAPRILDIHKPMGTIVAQGIKQAVVAAYLAKHYGGHEATGSSLRAPYDTITTKDHHALVTVRGGKRRHGNAKKVRAFLTKYYGTCTGQSLHDPIHTITAQAQRFGLVLVEGEEYQITDIGMRMLVPRELYRGQGFPDSYIIDPWVNEEPLSKTAQVRMCGNSVSPYMSKALVAANIHVSEEALDVA